MKRNATFPSLGELEHIYISPHLDDAVLSCGGLIFRQAHAGQRVAVVTVFAGNPPEDVSPSDFALDLHARWEAPNPTAARREEDLAALHFLHSHIAVIHLPLPECIYRRDTVSGAPLYATEEALFGNVHPTDPAFVALQAPPIISPGTLVYAPLGVGNHVDHQVVRFAADSWGMNLCYYEEYPYTIGDYQGAASSAPTGWRREVTLPDADSLAAKVRAIAHYASQISTFWDSLEHMAREIATYEERVWYPR